MATATITEKTKHLTLAFDEKIHDEVRLPGFSLGVCGFTY